MKIIYRYDRRLMKYIRKDIKDMLVDINYIVESLESIGYKCAVDGCREGNNNGRYWNIKFSNSKAKLRVFGSGTNNTVVEGSPSEEEKRFLKETVDKLKNKTFKIEPINKEIVELIDSKQEGTYYDFKEMRKKGHKLVESILALSNNQDLREAYLIIGVNDNYEVVGATNFDSDEVFNTLGDYHYGGGEAPEIDVLDNLYYKYKKIAVIVCKESKHIPFYLLPKGIDDNKRIKIYTRVGGSKHDATFSEREKLWQMRFNRQREQRND